MEENSVAYLLADGQVNVGGWQYLCCTDETITKQGEGMSPPLLPSSPLPLLPSSPARPKHPANIDCSL